MAHKHLPSSPRHGLLCWVAALLCWWATAANGAEVSAAITTVADDGAACWFQEPRALVVGGTTYVGWVGSRGDIGVSAFEHASGAVQQTVLMANQGADDHANPTLLLLPNGTLAAFHCKHNGDVMRVSLTSSPVVTDPPSPSPAAAGLEWGPPQEVAVTKEGGLSAGLTYPSPVLLPGGRAALFYRGINWQPTVTFSNMHLSHWTPPVQIFAPSGARAYAKYFAHGGRVHFVATDGHPRDVERNRVYYAYLQGEAWYRADGTEIKELGDGPLLPGEMDVVYDAGEGRAWVWDVAVDRATGWPVVLYTALPDPHDHRFMYAAWRGAPGGVGRGWVRTPITPGGRWFVETPEDQEEREPHYSGGLALDPLDPRVVFLSRPIDGVFEIERWQTQDSGQTWTSAPVTRRSARSNVRPFVARSASLGQTGGDGDYVRGGESVVAWMHVSGHYRHWQEYLTQMHVGIVQTT